MSTGARGWSSSAASSSRSSTCSASASASAGSSAPCPGPDGHPITYGAFVAPALLAASAMNGAIYEATLNVFFRLKYEKIYDAILATPVGAGRHRPRRDRLGAHPGAPVRARLHGRDGDPGPRVVARSALLAVPAAVVVGFGFAGAAMAATTWMRSWQDFDLVQLVVLPLFLFSGTFFPVSAYPPRPGHRSSS